MANSESEDGDRPVCGAKTDNTDGPCQFPVTDPGETCHMHPEDGERPEEHGRANNGNAVAAAKASGQGAPTGNKNPMTHGMYAAEQDPSGLFEYFCRESPAVASQIRRWFWSYMDDAPFTAYPGEADRYNPPDALDDVADEDEGDQDVDRSGSEEVPADAPPINVGAFTGKAHRLFVVCVHQSILTNVTLAQARDLLTAIQEVPNEGGIVEVEDELPVNLPKSRMRRRDLEELRALGVLDDPESQLADAQADWARAAQSLADNTESPE